MTSSMVSALAISDLILGASDTEWAVFAPRRLDLSASAANLWEECKQSVKGLCRSLFACGRTEVEELPDGHGGVVEAGGRKAGAYKTENGEWDDPTPIRITAPGLVPRNLTQRDLSVPAECVVAVRYPRCWHIGWFSATLHNSAAGEDLAVRSAQRTYRQVGRYR